MGDRRCAMLLLDAFPAHSVFAYSLCSQPGSPAPGAEAEMLALKVSEDKTQLNGCLHNPPYVT